MLVIGEALLYRHNLISHFSLDRHVVRRFLLAAEAAYANEKAANLYHNAVHGADVALTMHLFLTKFGQVERLTKTQLLAVLIAALMHDFNHPNTTNAHEAKIGSERARIHSDSSILERHHLHSTFTLLSYQQLDIFAPLSPEDRREVRALMIDLVLATDLSKHFDFIARLRTLCAAQGAAAAAKNQQNWSSTFHEVDLNFTLQVAIKFADLGHSFKSDEQHRTWTQRVTDEFHALGDVERKLGVPISALCDRRKDTNIARSQIGFFRYVLLPFYSAVADLIDPLMLPLTRFHDNFRAWQLQNMEQSAQSVTDTAKAVNELRQAPLNRSSTVALANAQVKLQPIGSQREGSSRGNSRRASFNPALQERSLRASREILGGTLSSLPTAIRE